MLSEKDFDEMHKLVSKIKKETNKQKRARSGFGQIGSGWTELVDKARLCYIEAFELEFWCTEYLRGGKDTSIAVTADDTRFS